MRIRISQRAQDEIDAARDWWIKNRDAHDLFDDELRSALRAIGAWPTIGQLSARRSNLRRVLIPRLRYHLYFFVTSAEVVIASMWHARRRPRRK